jgi:hypothetical protein
MGPLPVASQVEAVVQSFRPTMRPLLSSLAVLLVHSQLFCIPTNPNTTVLLHAAWNSAQEHNRRSTAEQATAAA